MKSSPIARVVSTTLLAAVLSAALPAAARAQGVDEFLEKLRAKQAELAAKIEKERAAQAKRRMLSGIRYPHVISNDGKLLAAGAPKAGMEIWELGPRPKKKLIGTREGQVKSIRFSGDSTHVSAIHTDGKLRVWKISNRRLIETVYRRSPEPGMPDFDFGYQGFEISADDRFRAMFELGKIILRDRDSKNWWSFEGVFLDLGPANLSLGRFWFFEDGQHLAAQAGSDLGLCDLAHARGSAGLPHLWHVDIRTGKKTDRPQQASVHDLGFVRSALYDRLGIIVTMRSEDGGNRQLRAWDALTGKPRWRRVPHEGLPFPVEARRSDHVVLAIDDVLEFRDGQTGHMVRQIPIDGFSVFHGAIAADASTWYHVNEKGRLVVTPLGPEPVEPKKPDSEQPK